jgi:hypothetical protein
MELALNLVWLFFAVSLLGFWHRQSRASGFSYLRELLAMVALVTILFPVVSVTDDLLVATNITETDPAVRRSLDGVPPHSIYPAGDAFPEAVWQAAPMQARMSLLQLPAPAFLPLGGALTDHAIRPPPTV